MMARSSSQYFCRAGIRRRRRPSFNLPSCEPWSIRHALVVFALAGLMSLPAAAPQALAAEDYAVLIISRERLEVPTHCEIGLYIQDQLAGRLFQEQATSFNLPPGDVSLRLKVLPSQAPAVCQACSRLPRRTSP